MASTTFEFTANLSNQNICTSTTAQAANTIEDLNSSIMINNKCEFTSANKDIIVARINNKVS